MATKKSLTSGRKRRATRWWWWWQCSWLWFFKVFGDFGNGIASKGWEEWENQWKVNVCCGFVTQNRQNRFVCPAKVRAGWQKKKKGMKRKPSLSGGIAPAYLYCILVSVGCEKIFTWFEFCSMNECLLLLIIKLSYSAAVHSPAKKEKGWVIRRSKTELCLLIKRLQRTWHNPSQSGQLAWPGV